MIRVAIRLYCLISAIPTLLHITYCRVTGRVRWFFLFRSMFREPHIASAIIETAEAIFKENGEIARVTGLIYRRRGYGEESSDGNLTLYWEAPFAITVWLGDKPALGMSIEWSDGFIYIRQLQGVKGVRLVEEFREWPQLFIKACLEAAERGGLRGVRIYQANQSLFYRYPSLDIQNDANEETQNKILLEHQKRMRRRYDGTARQMGFNKKKRFYEMLISK